MSPTKFLTIFLAHFRNGMLKKSVSVHYPTHEPSEPSITELEDLRGERIEMIPSDETAVVEDAPSMVSTLKRVHVFCQFKVVRFELMPILVRG